MSSRDRVRIASGVIEGTRGTLPDVRAFLGIPYAAPPVGLGRWRPPEPVAPWSGVRPAQAFGARAVQTSPFPDMVFRSARESEDCLTLSVWTPRIAADARLPVMVWIHGGGFFAGSSDEARHEGSALASKGAVIVAVNYRLGVLGFLAHPELTAESLHGASGNYGLLDQVAALQWVRENIAAFGGDADNVTVFGESAGSFSVSALMTSPLAGGLFHKAIGQSGAYLGNSALPLHSLTTAETMGAEYAASLGAASLAELRSLSPASLVQAVGREPTRFAPILDGYLLTSDPWDVFCSGRQMQVPLLAGWNSAEVTVSDATVESFVAARRLVFPDDESASVVYPATNDREACLSATALASNTFIGYNTWKWIETHPIACGALTYRYLFDQRRPSPIGVPSSEHAGAGHASDIEFVFNTLDTRALPWRADDRRLADLIGSYWTTFARTGDPNGEGLPAWPAWDPSGGRQVMRLAGTPRAEAETHRHQFLLHDQVAIRGRVAH